MTTVSPRFAGTCKEIPLTTRKDQPGKLTMPEFIDVVRGLELRKAQYGGGLEALAYERDGDVYGAIATRDDDKEVTNRLMDAGVVFSYTGSDFESGQIRRDCGDFEKSWMIEGGAMRGPDKAKAASEATARLYELA